MEEKPFPYLRGVLRFGGGRADYEYYADYGVKENTAKLFKKRQVCGIY